MAKSTASTKTGPKVSARQTHKEKKAAAAKAARKAQIQWYAIGAALVVAVAATIVIISVFTEGELPTYGVDPRI